VSEVHHELVRNRGRFAAGRAHHPPPRGSRRIAHLSSEGLMWVAAHRAVLPRPVRPRPKNVGELATARLAGELIAAGRRPIVLVDDRLGAGPLPPVGRSGPGHHEVVVEMGGRAR